MLYSFFDGIDFTIRTVHIYDILFCYMNVIMQILMTKFLYFYKVLTFFIYYYLYLWGIYIKIPFNANHYIFIYISFI